MFAVYCLHRQDMRFVLYLDHPTKVGYTMKMQVSDLDSWASQLVSNPPWIPLVTIRANGGSDLCHLVA